MWSPTKLDFLFYDFFVSYYSFSKILRCEEVSFRALVLFDPLRRIFIQNKHKRKRGEPLRETT